MATDPRMFRRRSLLAMSFALIWLPMLEARQLQRKG
jgi:hypothetical protein